MHNAGVTIRRPVSDSAAASGRPAKRARILELARKIGESAHREADDYARERGWTTTRTHAGLGRVYRDPRFDALAACNSCAGSGVREDAPCSRCAGTGRITLKLTSARREG
jgi:hypothetical protein